MARLTFSEDERQQLQTERYEHPHPRVQQRMEVLWLISCGESYAHAGRLAGVSHATVDRYVALYRERGIEGLKQFNWKGPTSELAAHQTTLEELFQAQPPHTIAEACRRITELEREILKKRRRISRRSRSEIRLDRPAPRPIPDHRDV
jgi:transposase